MPLGPTTRQFFQWIAILLGTVAAGVLVGQLVLMIT